MRTHPFFGFAPQIYRDYGRFFYVVGFAEKLFYYLAAAFPDRHRAERAVSGMAVRTHYHCAAFCLSFAHITVDYAEICGNEVAAVFLCGGETEGVVVFVYSAADGAQRVMAVRERVWQRKLFHSRRFCRLNYAYVRYVVRCERVEADFKILPVAPVVRG